MLLTNGQHYNVSQMLFYVLTFISRYFDKHSDTKNQLFIKLPTFRREVSMSNCSDKSSEISKFRHIPLKV